ncbi:hypothetical protein IFM89_037743 [Coptis chinensis]|uniref:DUF4283 domain-containing protein n=1 Tax=Coptis chinensis TaxID=261450 RepID=A0A835IVR5_9MAGN|nr:hypothetical protein IFM89_037743 [Coptis chinensis]
MEETLTTVLGAEMGKAPVFCPWGFLNEEGTQNARSSIEVVEKLRANGNVTDKGQETQRKSYARATKTTYGREVDTAALPVPGRQGEYPTITIHTEEVDKGLEFCKLVLVGRLDMSKLTMNVVNEKVKQLWKPNHEWQATPLGRGYIMFRFTNELDYHRIWGQGTWVFDDQILRLSKWTLNFSTSKENHSNALVWIRFPGLSLEYWEIKTLFSLARAIGRPIHTDENTTKRTLGYYASVLMDLDLNEKIPDKIWVEVEGKDIKFWQSVEPGCLPKFCNHCKRVGHLVTECRVLKVDLSKNKEKENNSTTKLSMDGISKNQRKRNKEVKEVINVTEDTNLEKEVGQSSKEQEQVLAATEIDTNEKDDYEAENEMEAQLEVAEVVDLQGQVHVMRQQEGEIRGEEQAYIESKLAVGITCVLPILATTPSHSETTDGRGVEQGLREHWTQLLEQDQVVTRVTQDSPAKGPTTPIMISNIFTILGVEEQEPVSLVVQAVDIAAQVTDNFQQKFNYPGICVKVLSRVESSLNCKITLEEKINFGEKNK